MTDFKESHLLFTSRRKRYAYPLLHMRTVLEHFGHRSDSSQKQKEKKKTNQKKQDSLVSIVCPRPSPFFNPVANKHTLTNPVYTSYLYLSLYRFIINNFLVTSPITLANLSSINLVSIFRCSSPPRHPVYPRRVDPSVLAFSPSSHRHSYISLPLRSRFITMKERRKEKNDLTSILTRV